MCHFIHHIFRSHRLRPFTNSAASKTDVPKHCNSVQKFGDGPQSPCAYAEDRPIVGLLEYGHGLCLDLSPYLQDLDLLIGEDLANSHPKIEFFEL